jgi:hypothetical protein
VSQLPRFLLRNTVTVEPYQGNSANGPLYGPAMTVACYLEDGRKITRRDDGTEATSTARFFARIDALPDGLAPSSRVTLPDGRQTSVIQADRLDGAGLPTPDHWQVSLEAGRLR